jgi:hypothetical protein
MVNWSEFLDKLDKVEEDLIGEDGFPEIDTPFDLDAIDEIREAIENVKG